jgi:hypothetical protein
MLFAGIVAAIDLVFTAVLLMQYLERRRPYQLAWTISLALSFVGALAFLLSIALGKNMFWFRVYYWGGALLGPGYLGLGTLYLLAPKRWAQIWLYVMLAATVLGAIGLGLAPVNAAHLAEWNADLSGRGVLELGATTILIIFIPAAGALMVFVGALYSAYRVIQKRMANQLFVANLFIAFGTSLISVAGGSARFQTHEVNFWAVMAVGWVILFAGFMLTRTHARLGLPAVAARKTEPAH